MEYLKKGGMIFIIILLLITFRFHIVMSGSMEPVIHTGSLAVIVPWDHTVKEGDVILYKTGDISVLHRVVEVLNNQYITKGDANQNNDFSPVYSGQIQGKYLISIPYAGYFLFYLKKYIFFVLTVNILLILWRRKNEFKSNYDKSTMHS